MIIDTFRLLKIQIFVYTQHTLGAARMLPIRAEHIDWIASLSKYLHLSG